MPVPTRTIYSVLGAPEEDIDSLSQKGEVRSSGSATASESADANKELVEYMQQLVDKKIDNPGDDLISKLVTEQLKPGHIEKDDVVNLAFLVLVAGNATMMNMIGLGVVTLLQHPEQLNELKSDLCLAKPTVEELLRYHTASALFTRRVAKEYLTVRDKQIKANEDVIASNQSANRDEEVFPDPDKLDIHRKNADANLGFGHGPHRCLGEWLSRAELEVLFGTLFQKLPNLKLAVPASALKYTPPTKDVETVKLPVDF